MRRKIVGILVCMLLIMTAVPVVGLAEDVGILAYNKDDGTDSLTLPSNDAYDTMTVSYYENGDILDQQQTIDIGYGWWVLHNCWEAQGFVPSLPILTRVRLYVFELGAPNVTELIVTIRDNLTGDDLTEALIYGPTGAQWVEFDFPDIEVTPGEDYYIVCKAPEGNNYDNCYCWYFGIDDPYEDGGAWYSINYGATWDIREYPPWEWYDNDFCFETYGLDQWYPDIPEIDGPPEGTAGIEYDYTFVTTDPEGDNVFYWIVWGDGSPAIEWIGPYNSGEEVTLNHTFEEQGTYMISAKAKDVNEAESDWGYLEVEMPLDQELTSLPVRKYFGLIRARWTFAFRSASIR